MLKSSELVVNSDGSIYHLNIRKEDLASTVFFVGNPDRVPMVSKYFDEVELKIQKREFVTHTGMLNGKRLSVISTGIGPDNIDIVINELDALVNFDLNTKELKKEHTSLNIIRLGTSGSLHKDIPVSSLVISEGGLGFDNVLHFYEYKQNKAELEIQSSFLEQIKTPFPSEPYYFDANETLLKLLLQNNISGITATCPGFYGPQGRQLRAAAKFPRLLDDIRAFQHHDKRITNFEMETSAICGLSKILGHRAISCNTILANRATGEFAGEPKIAVDQMIQKILERVSEVDLPE